MIFTVIRKSLSNCFVKNTIILFIGTNVANLLNYLFNLILGRLLAVGEYGELIALESIFLIFGVLGTTIGSATTRQVAVLKAKNDFENLKIIKQHFEKIFFLIGGVLFLLFLLLSRFIISYLKISSLSLIILSIGFIFIFVAAFYSAFLQGLQRFKAMSLIIILGVVIKIVVGVGFVLLGFSTSGAVAGYVFPILFSTVFAYLLIRDIGEVKIVEAKQKIRITSRHLTYLGNFFLASLCLALLYNVDLLMVKHYFSSHEAGLYSSLAILARIIFFGTGVIAAVLLPMSTERFEKGEKHFNLFKLSLFLVGGSAIFLNILYFIFPKFIILFLFDTKYLEGANLLWIMALMMSVFTILNLFVTYLISLKEFTFLPVMIVGAILQIILIYFFHTSLFQVIMISLTIICGILLILILSFLRGRILMKIRYE